MKANIFTLVCKVALTLILLLPVMGALGIFPAPTRDLYNTDAAFNFILSLNDARYINFMMSAMHVLAVGALWTRREALAALLIAPITANVVGFHAFLDGGLFTAGSSLADVMLALNIYFLWKYRAAYAALWVRR